MLGTIGSGSSLGIREYLKEFSEPWARNNKQIHFSLSSLSRALSARLGTQSHDLSRPRPRLGVNSSSTHTLMLCVSGSERESNSVCVLVLTTAWKATFSCCVRSVSC